MFVPTPTVTEYDDSITLLKLVGSLVVRHYCGEQ